MLRYTLGEARFKVNKHDLGGWYVYYGSRYAYRKLFHDNLKSF